MEPGDESFDTMASLQVIQIYLGRRGLASLPQEKKDLCKKRFLLAQAMRAIKAMKCGQFLVGQV